MDHCEVISSKKDSLYNIEDSGCSLGAMIPVCLWFTGHKKMLNWLKALSFCALIITK